jgi:hypothetical protein
MATRGEFYCDELREESQIRFVFPGIPPPILKSLCGLAKKQLEDDPSMIRINQDCVIIGDLHGHRPDPFPIRHKCWRASG